VTDEESLAARAAAWVPPWAREPDAEPESPTEPAGSLFEAAVAEPAESPTEPAESPTEPVEEAQPVEDLVEAAVAEPVAEAEPVPPPELEGFGEPLPAEEPPPPVVDLRPALEAILMVVDEPVTEVVLAQVLEQPTERVGAELAALAEEYTARRRGFGLRRAAGGWRFYTHPDQAVYVERFILDGQSVRLTQAALETLAVVAYKQPVTRSRISAIRGVNCDGVVRTLVTRGLIEECGTEAESGAHLYRTSNLFLEKLGLDSVEQLPPLAPFLPDDVDEIADAQRG